MEWRSWLPLALMVGVALAVRARAGALDSGPVSLSVQAGSPVCFTWEEQPGGEFLAESPLCLQLLSGAGATLWLSNSYSSVTQSGTTLCGVGTVQTPGGSVFQFTDRFQPGPEKGSFLLQREVVVLQASGAEAGFLSRFSVRPWPARPLSQLEVFIPGIWYRDNRHVPSHALAADLAENCFLCREDRMPLPLVMMRDKLSGVALTLVHFSPDGKTCLADYAPERVVDAEIQVASLGIFGQANAAAALVYPASEGERSYLLRRAQGRGGRARTSGWVERFHPVKPGVQHAYSILICVSQQPSFPRAMRQAWRVGFDHLHPPVAQVDIAASYDASLQLVAHWSHTTRGAPGVPFRLRLPRGELEDEEKMNYQMGFVGQQLPLAYHLLRCGLLRTNEALVQKGEATVDFWATNSLTGDGLPRTWFDTWPEPHWRNYNTFLRVACDGMAGAVMAYDVMAAGGRPKPEWLTFCRRFGDWLVAHQNPDGSWYREYGFDSSPADKSPQNTSHPIRYLVDLFKLTGERRYLRSAERAGAWCWTNVHEAFSYVGGTVDNPNVIDKEAGFLALEAFLALRDATGQARWLEAAAQAGDFTETWAYCWNVPIPADDKQVTYPRGATTTGFSLIACGHSGADLFLAGAPFLFYRLYLQTGDRHYGEIARQLLYDTRQSMDINGSRGYGHPGLCTEALSLAPPRGRGVNTWLPWLSYSMLEPVVRLQEAYGVMDTPRLAGPQWEEFVAKDKEFARTRGLHSAAAHPAQP
jgi:hypothetical protein